MQAGVRYIVDGRANRYFIGTATTEHPHNRDLADRPQLASALTQMRDLFTKELGYSDVEGFAQPNLTAHVLRRRLGDFLTSDQRSPQDIVTFYYTGHGLLEGDKFFLPLADSTADHWRTAVSGEDLANWLFGGVKVGAFLIILDTCFSGAAASALAKDAIGRLHTAGSRTQTVDTAVIAASRPREQARSLAFSTEFIKAVRHPANGGIEPRFLPLDSIVQRTDRFTPDWQKAQLFYTGGGVGEFLPNHRFDPRLHDFDLRSRDAEQARLREEELAAFVAPRAAGLDAPMDGRWLFTGREHALGHLSGWLRRPADDSAALVVTGNPGSGKSAVLARLFLLSDDLRRRTIPDAGALPRHTVPDLGSIRRFIHARGKTAAEVLAGICEAVETHAESVAELLAVLRRRRERAITVIVDAVDEAIDPDDVVQTVLAPLIRNATPCHVRLLIGTRRHLLQSLPCPSIDIDAGEFADPISVQRYARRCLLDLVPESPYLRASAAMADQVAGAVGRAAGESFLVALIVARGLALRREVVERPGDPAWQAKLPRRAAEAMQQDIDERLGDRKEDARDLLLPLAYAQGVGLPWENVWAHLANAVSGKRYRDEDLMWLVREAGYYIVETKEDGRSCYRLFHESLAEHLRTRGTRKVHSRMVAGLRDLVRNGEWSSAHPYVRRHLATHAARAGEIDGYLLDPLFLVAADRTRVLAAALSAKSEQARRAAIAFQQASQASAADADERLAYLELAAHQYGAADLADRLRHLEKPRPWRTESATWAPVAPHRVLHRGRPPVLSVAVVTSSGRPCIAAVCLDGLYVWRLETGETLREGLDRRPFQAGLKLVTLADGTAAIVSRQGRKLHSTSLEARALDHSWGRVGKRLPIWAVTIDDRSRVLTPQPGSETVVVWDPVTGRRLGTWRPPLGAHPVDVRSGFVNGRSSVLIADESGRVSGWDLLGSAPTVTFESDFLRTRFVLTGTLDRREVVGLIGHKPVSVEVLEARPLPESDAPWGSTENTFILPNLGASFAPAPYLTLRVFDAQDGSALDIGYDLAEDCKAAALATMDGRAVLVTGGDDGVIRIRELAVDRILGELYGHDGAIHDLDVHQAVQGGSVIVSGGIDGTVRVWDLAASLFTRDMVTASQTAVDTAEKQQQPSAAVVDSAVHRMAAAWRTESAAGMAFTTLNGTPMVVTGGGDDCTVHAWDLKTRGSYDYWFAHANGVWAVTAFVQAGEPVVLSGGGDGAVRAWDLKSGTLTRTVWQDPKDRVTALCVVPMGASRAIIAGTGRGFLHILDVNGEPLGRPVRLPAEVTSVVSAEEESKLVVQCGDVLSAVLLAPTRRGGVSASVGTSVDASVSGLAYDRERQRWAARSGDRVIQYDVASRTVVEIDVWSPVRSVEFDAEGRLIVTAADGLVTLLVDNESAGVAERRMPSNPLFPLLSLTGASLAPVKMKGALVLTGSDEIPSPPKSMEDSYAGRRGLALVGVLAVLAIVINLLVLGIGGALRHGGADKPTPDAHDLLLYHSAFCGDDRIVVKWPFGPCP